MSKYEKNWESIDSRPVPEWFDKAKFGIFIHWGLYSVPAYAPKRKNVDSAGLAYSEWYGWQVKQKFPPYYDFHKRVYGENFEYEDFACQWKAEMFDPDHWAELFSYAGAKYLVLVSKHHDAFCLWPSYYSWNWNSVDIGPHRDIVKDLCEAVEKKGIRKGLYYSLLEWTHPVLQRPDPINADIPKYAVEKMIPQMKELVETYEPNILFTDGEWSFSSEKWHSLDFLTWLYNESKVKDYIVVNDRWGSDTRAQHGGYVSSEYGEVSSPTQSEEESKNMMTKRKWEECRSIGASFGFNRNENIEDYLTEGELIDMFVDIVSRGGNLCLNVGPNADGTISPVIEERLRQLGDWMKVNSEAIYDSTVVQVDGLPAYAKATKAKEKNAIYILCNKYPKEEITIANSELNVHAKVSLLGSNENIQFTAGEKAMSFKAPYLTVDEMPCKNVYTFKINLM
jgi:alpha-L-fucosidase